jgi:hypothetical protein
MLIASPVPDGSLLVDTYEPLDLASCLQLSALGYHGCIRYIDNLTPQEVDWITLDGKMGLMLIRSCRRAGWIGTAMMGTSDGQQIAHAAAVLGLPKGVSGFIDDEGAGGNDSDELSYLNAASESLSSYCLAGLYVGEGTHLSSAQLYHDLKFTRYFRSASDVPWVEVRGYCLVQEPPLDRTLSGLPDRTFDVSKASADALGGQLSWAIAV